MPVRILTAPKIILISQPALVESGLREMKDIVEEFHPECHASGGDVALFSTGAGSDAEILPEIAGRTCYYSFGDRMGKKTSVGYLANLARMGHMSCFYHVKFTWFIFGLSRRVGEEFLRHYVGADRDKEGSPSKESTRYTEHQGLYVAQPGDINPDGSVDTDFAIACEENAQRYRETCASDLARYHAQHGTVPAGLARKRIYERAAGRLNLQAACSFVWTSNPVAMAKFFRERSSGLEVDPAHAADLEIQRFAALWRKMCLDAWPGLCRALL